MSNLSNSSKINAYHLAKKAIIYLRQSSPGQVKNNLESQRLQYALADRARALGFTQVEVIDIDLGASAASGSRQRPGFQQLLTSVAVGDVGIILSRELSRLSRTDKDWCHLMEICQIFNTLIGDDESVYDPAHYDDQLILGIKGTISVAELNVIRMRLIQGKEAKAMRGELFCTVAPGYIREGETIIKDPNTRVREVIELIFSQFQVLGSLRQTCSWFMDNEIEVPVNKSVHGQFQVVWKLPAQTFIPSVIHNPIYAGAYVYGRRVTTKIIDNGEIKKRQEAYRSPDKAKVFIKDHHEGYISWETHLRYQQMIDDNGTNFQPDEAMLAVRKGHGLLASLLRCKRCGHKLNVRYWGKSGTIPRYLCSGNYSSGGSYCIGFGGKAADKAIEHEVLGVISPMGIDASITAIEHLNDNNNDQLNSLKRQYQQAEYESKRAFNQYDHVDPNNRLVADNLEQRWNEKLNCQEEIRQRIVDSQVSQRPLSDQDKESLTHLGQNFSVVWLNPQCDIAIKKKIIRTLIKEIIVDIDEQNELLKFIIHWHGGSHTTIDVPRPMPANKAHKTTDEDADIIIKMSKRYDDTEIAKVLSKLGRTTGKGHNWNKHNVGTMRRRLGIKAVKILKDDLVLNVSEATRYCAVSNSTIMKLIKAGVLPANQIVQHAPFEINKADLDSEPAAGIITTLKKTGKLHIKGGVLADQAELAL